MSVCLSVRIKMAQLKTILVFYHLSRPRFQALSGSGALIGIELSSMCLSMEQRTRHLHPHLVSCFLHDLSCFRLQLLSGEMARKSFLHFLSRPEVECTRVRACVRTCVHALDNGVTILERAI